MNKYYASYSKNMDIYLHVGIGEKAYIKIKERIEASMLNLVMVELTEEEYNKVLLHGNKT